MKNYLAVFPIAILLLSASVLVAYKKPLVVAKENTEDTTMNYTVVELFTSEGCSSCPSADKVLADINTKYNSKVIVLGFHVDYWNRLGWKDKFSDASYTQRQQQYASAHHSEQVYTPQAIVNGKEEMVGSDQAKLVATIDRYVHSPGKTAIQLLATEQKGSRSVTVDYSFAAMPNNVLNIALLESDAVTQVKAGENKGLTLHHISVVRDFKTVQDAKGRIQLQLPENIAAKDCRIVGYVQDKGTMKINSATAYIVPM